MVALLGLASSCLAVAPIKGGRYAGTTSSGGFVAFNVDDRGRAFVSSQRLVLQGSEIEGPCSKRPWDLGGATRPDVTGAGRTPGKGKPRRGLGGGPVALSGGAKDGGGKGAR